jgi:integrase
VKITKRTLKDGSTRYEYRVIIEGRKEYVCASTKAEVERRVAALKEKARRRRLGLPDPDERPLDLTYAALVEKALDSYPHSDQAKTALSYNLKRSKDAFGNVLVRELTTEQISAWPARLRLRQTTKRNTLKALRYALGRAVIWGYLRDNPARSVDWPNEPQYDAHPFDSWEEVRKVAAAARDPRDSALILFACATGLRPQEWLALRWSDLRLSDRSFTVTRTVQDGVIVEASGKTRASLRTVLLNNFALEALNSLPTPLRHDFLVFPGKRGGIIDHAKWRRDPWRRALATAEVPYREPTGMRDTFATLHLAAGNRLEWISKQMGHSSTTVTERHYARWLRSGEDAELDRMNLALSQTDQKSTSRPAEAEQA